MPTFNTTDPKPGYVYDSDTDTWYPLQGIAPSSEVTRWTKTAVGGETSLSGLDDFGSTLSYTPGVEQVFLNGVLLVRGEDYIGTTGTSITGLSPALTANDIVVVLGLTLVNVNTIVGIPETDINAKGDLIVGTAPDTAGILTAGTNEQRLVVDSSTGTGLKYVSDTTNYAVSAKGDLLVGTAADTITNLSTGTTGQVLTVDPATASGLKWSTPAGWNPNYQLLNAGGTALTGASTITVSGISGVSSLYIVIDGASSANANASFSLRLNSDSTSAYKYAGITVSDGTIASSARQSAATSYDLGGVGTATNTIISNIIVYGTNSSGIKTIQSASGVVGENNSRATSFVGSYSGSSAISSVSIISSTGNFDAGTIFVYGA